MNERDLQQTTQLLVDGAKQGDVEKITIALANGADIHFNHDEALYAASWRGRDAAVRLLIERGADARSRESAGARAAAEFAHRGIVELLVSNGADPDALHILDLIEQGFSLSSKAGRFALQAASSAGCLPIARAVMRYARCKFTQADIAEAIANALRRKHGEMARYLIEAAANVHDNPVCLPPIIRAWRESNAFRSILRYDSESKKRVVSVLLDSNLPIKDAAAAIGVTPRTLRRWTKQFAPDEPDFPKWPREKRLPHGTSALLSETTALRNQCEVMKKVVERLCQ